MHLHVVELDVTDQVSFDVAVQTGINTAGRLDVVINNARVGSYGIEEAFTIE